MEDLLFTWKVVKFTKSNGIAIGKDKQSVGIGPGQVNRIWATEQAIDHGTKQLGADVVKGDACNKYGIAMVFSGMRHFRH